jgi:hypothetical protein
MTGRVATRDLWKTTPMPEAKGLVPYARRFEAAEYVRLGRGLVPRDMDDRWFIFYQGPWLFLHRSWTGTCIYAVKLREEGEGAAVDEAWVNRLPEQYRASDAEHEAKMLAFLVDHLLLGLAPEFPLRENVAPDKAPLLKQQVIGQGRSNDEE